MRLLARLAPRSILTLPRGTVRLRLTLLYGSLFLISGSALLAITYLLVRHSTRNAIFFGFNIEHGHAPTVTFPPTPQQTRQLGAEATRVRLQATHQHAAELHQLLIQSGVALGIMTVVSLALGWFVAGRVLRPLRTITATARRISQDNLHQRLALQGPRDEVRDLADTIDSLLGRLEAAFDAQRRFVADASHELRTPMTLERALLEEALTDNGATLDSFRSTGARLLTIGEQQERLLEALLTLASGERGLDRNEPFDLAAVTDAVLLTPRPEIEPLELDIETQIAPAPTSGDPRLVERLVANLIDNAVCHNVPHGRVTVQTGTRGRQPFISVTNSGAVIQPKEVGRLLEPFQRLDATRTAGAERHHGLGLSIVRAIATAHHATLVATARPEGGLAVDVSFPVSAQPRTPSSSGPSRADRAAGRGSDGRRRVLE